MPFDSLSESGLFEVEQYLNSTSHRKHAMNKLYVPKTDHLSVRSHRLNHQNKPSFVAFHPLIDNNQKDSSTLDRNNYKLRMKSDLNVDTLPETHIHRRPRRHYYQPQNRNNNDAFSVIPSSATTKTFSRQATPMTMATNSTKTTVDGIEGNAVPVRTLDDLIKQIHREEFRLIRHPVEYSDNASTPLSNYRSINERQIAKPSLYPLERVIKQPQALTEYHFNAPNFPYTAPQVYRYRVKETNTNPDLPPLTDQYHQRSNSTQRQPTIDKQSSNCNRVTFIDPFNPDQNPFIWSSSQKPTPRFIFPPIRPFGYFTRKSTNDPSHSPPSSVKKKCEIKKKRQYVSKASLDQIGTNDTDSTQSDGRIKSVTSLTDLDDDLQNPPNTTINFDLKQNKQS